MQEHLLQQAIWCAEAFVDTAATKELVTKRTSLLSEMVPLTSTPSATYTQPFSQRLSKPVHHNCPAQPSPPRGPPLPAAHPQAPHSAPG